MKFQSLAVLATLAASAAAFPNIGLASDSARANSARWHEEKLAERTPFAAEEEVRAAAEGGCPFAARREREKRATFNAQAQKVSVSGEHAWKAPDFSRGDQRGPCPGLNALANHGYLPHNGVADMLTIIKATNEVYGMSLDLGGFLAVYGTVFNGNPLSTNPGYSIGGPSQYSQNILGGLGLLGTPSGLSGTHNKYESDVSPTRGDLYTEGNNFHVVRSRFIDYWNELEENIPSSDQYTKLAPFHAQRFDQSKSTNPYFFYSPFAGVLVSPAGYSFPARMMANHSAEFPNGMLSKENLASFFGVTGDSPSNFVVKQGHERIPENWYKRPIGDDYSIPKFLVDVLEHAAMHPELLSIGGNTGKVNSFAGVDLKDLTGGVFSFADLAKGNNLLCLSLQIIQAASPDLLGSMFSDVEKAMAPLTDELQQLLAGKSCPQLQKVNFGLFKKFPGYTKSYGTYAGLSKGTPSGLVTGVAGLLGGLIPINQKKN